jgi:hypothetical protein
MPPAFSRIVDDREDWKGSKFGAALSPLESAAPISTPVPHSPEVGVAIFCNDLQSLGETQKHLVLRIFVNCCCQSTCIMYARKQPNSISFGHGPHARHELRATPVAKPAPRPMIRLPIDTLDASST